ncbi:MAG: ABC transporter substrate-binding protein, partial [Asgard group archaeon]|nr:ABC transporter substrate-binding protein [Asgard group archaeon]
YQYESVYDAEWLSQIFQPLIQRYGQNENYGYGARLADSWETTDFLNYTIELNPAAVWSDGTPLTTDDVEFSYKLQITPAFNNPDFSFWSNYLRNNSVTITDADTCVISFNQTYVFQEGNLALDLVPKHIWESVPYGDMEQQAIDWSLSEPEKMVGSGPFVLEEYNPTTATMTLVRNDNFDDWAGVVPYFDEIYFVKYSNKEGALSALAGGSVDMVSCYFSPLESDIPTGMASDIIAAPGTQEMAFNCLQPWIGTGELCPISDPDSGKYIRQAISHIIPREVICTEILEGLAVPAATPMPNVAIGWNPALLPLEYSIDIAKQKMELAGFEYPPETSPTPTETTGVGLYVVMGILALAGASQVFFLKRRK